MSLAPTAGGRYTTLPACHRHSLLRHQHSYIHKLISPTGFPSLGSPCPLSGAVISFLARFPFNGTWDCLASASLTRHPFGDRQVLISQLLSELDFILSLSLFFPVYFIKLSEFSFRFRQLIGFGLGWVWLFGFIRSSELFYGTEEGGLRSARHLPSTRVKSWPTFSSFPSPLNCLRHEAFRSLNPMNSAG